MAKEIEKFGGELVEGMSLELYTTCFAPTGQYYRICHKGTVESISERWEGGFTVRIPNCGTFRMRKNQRGTWKWTNNSDRDWYSRRNDQERHVVLGKIRNWKEIVA